MARALIVEGGERGVALAEALRADGWAVRASARDADRRTALEAAGIEAAPADPARLGTLVDAIEGVAVIVWLLGDGGAADASPDEAHELNAGVLARLLEEIVDTPVRGVAYESWGAGEAARAPAAHANETWRIGIAPIDAEPGDGWLAEASAAVTAALG